MKTINARIAEQNLIIEPSVLSVAESVNAYSLKIEYDEEWSEVDSKVVTFKGANGIAIAIQDNGEENGVVIPWEVLNCPGKVTVGVVGYKGTELKLTTTGLYDRNTFVVLPASFGLASAMTPTPDIYQKLLQTINQFNEGLGETNEKIGNLNNLETEAKDNLVAAINEVLSGGGGQGTVKSVNQVQPDEDGNVTLSPADIGAPTAEALSAEIAERQEGDTLLQSAINGKQDALTQSQLNAVNSGIDSTKVGQIATNATDIDTIEGKIPAQATAQNQLADKAFVNSSVATNTANYISDNGQPFTSLQALEAYSGTLTNNDYAFVVGTDQTGNTTYTRYKYVADQQEWAEEYVLNNSSFTANQWASINSGITSGDVAKLAGITAGAEPNVIDGITVNGTPVTPDANKIANLTIDEVIKTLTTADYNYSYAGGEYNGVALWLLPTGLYKIVPGVKVYFRRGNTQVSSTVDLERDSIAFAFVANGKILISKTATGTGVSTTWSSYLIDNTGLVSSGSGSLDILNRSNIRNVLTSTSANDALSANMGKQLNDTKADKTAFTGTDGSTAGTMGLVPAPATTDADKFLKSDGSWGEAGGGGITELTSEDYNYPTSNPSSIALWLLSPGVYKLKGALSYKPTSSSSYYGYADKELVVLISNFGGNTNKLILFPDGYCYHLQVVTSSGSTSTYSFGGGSVSTVLTGATVRNNLTSTDATFPLSAYQGRVLNERIGDLSTLTTTDKASLIAAINELNTRLSALEGN